MPLYTKTGFAELCGRKLAHVSQDISRKKVVVGDKDLIDSTNQFNAAYLEKWLAKKPLAETHPIKASDVAYQSRTSGKPATRPVKRSTNEELDDLEDLGERKLSGASLFQLEVEKKEKDIELITENIEIAKVKKEKLHGMVIPTGLVTMLFTQHTASIISSLAQANENLLMDLSKTKGINRTDLGKLREQLTKHLNTAIDDSVVVSKKGLQALIDNYSFKRSPGERK